MPKRPVNATVAELEAAKKLLQDEISAVRLKAGEIDDHLQNCDGRLEAEVKAREADTKSLTGRAGNLAHKFEGLESQTQVSISQLSKEVASLQPLLRDSIRQAQVDLEKRIAEVDQCNRDDTARDFHDCRSDFASKLEELSKALEASIERASQVARQELHHQRTELDSALGDARKEANDKADVVQQHVLDELARSVQAQDEVNRLHEKNSQQFQAHSRREFQRLEEELQERGVALENAQEKASGDMGTELGRVKDEAQKRLASLDDHVEQAMRNIRNTISDVENIPTKKIEWVIAAASRSVKAPGQAAEETYSSWLSPRFDAAGARGLQLELRVYKRLPAGLPAAEGQERGDCVVLMRAARGTNIVFRLYIGSSSQSFERNFCSDDDACGTSRLCFLADKIGTMDDRLRIGVEVQESVYQLDKLDDRPATSGGEGEPRSPALQSHLVLHRHVNNRLLQQVRSQVEHFKARTVRRVEWCLEEASVMVRSFPRGAPMCSKEFDAAGIEGMQLVFFPSGYDGASDGFCSLFLSAPAGTTLRCHLQAGTERRELNHTYDTPGRFGRTNFCRFESAIDVERNVVMVSLEVEDAHQDMVARAGHLPPPSAGMRSLVDEPRKITPLGSVLKLQRQMPYMPPELKEVKVLPALRAAKNCHDPVAKADMAASLSRSASLPFSPSGTAKSLRRTGSNGFRARPIH